MWLTLQGVAGSGVDMLDTGLSDSVVIETAQGLFVLTSTGRNGGLVSYRVNDDGSLTEVDTLIFGDNVSNALQDVLSVVTIGAETIVFFGANNSELVGYRLNEDGTIGGLQRVGWSELEAAIAQGAPGALEAWAAHSGATPWGAETIALQAAVVGGQTYALALDGAGAQVTSHAFDPGSGHATEAGSIGAAQGLGIAAPTGMEVVAAHGRTWVVLAAAGSSSLSVLELRSDGSLRATDHVIDTGGTRFAGVQALAVAQAGDHVFVVAGGADHGLTLFALVPGGRLVWLDTLADTDASGLYNVATLSAVVSGDRLVITAGSQRDSGVTVVTVPLGELGGLQTGTSGAGSVVQGGAGHDILVARGDGDTLRGGAGNDILVSGPGETHMEGGSGADTFVILATSGTTRILDFQRGTDRLDLSDWSMLRTTAQLTVTPTDQGARIEYQGHVLILTASDRAPLQLHDIFPHGLTGPDRVLVPGSGETPPPPPQPPDPPPPPPPPGSAHDADQWIEGTPGNDTLQGGAGNDTIHGLAGDDLIFGEHGNNELWGGEGRDTIWGGSGNDLIEGGPGDDLLQGGAGNNTIWGGRGNDTIWGGAGDDIIGGGDGDDLIYGVGGDNELWGSEGNDTIFAGTGHDTVGGGPDNDLIIGAGARNELWGGRGNDTIHAGDSGDVIGGGPGDDMLIGGAGSDTIYAAGGNDQLWGGGGADRFYFYRDYNWNRIHDFTPAEGDLLMLGPGLWREAGTLTPWQVADRFARTNGDGDLVLDFGPANTVIVLVGFDDFQALVQHIHVL